MKQNALNLLGISKKGGNVAIGEEPTGAAARAGKASLILVAEDAADHTVRRARSFSEVGKTAFIRVPFSKAELGGIVGRSVCAMAAVTDVRLALAFVRALDEPEQNAQLLETLEQGAARAQQRQKEAAAHRENVRRRK